MAGVDDGNGVGVDAHPGVSASAAFTTIARHVVSRNAAAARRRHRQQTSAI